MARKFTDCEECIYNMTCGYHEKEVAKKLRGGCPNRIRLDDDVDTDTDEEEV